jgi:RHS repeat-associated protein
MRWVAAKKRSLFSLAALCALAGTLVAPAPALATRTFAGANGRLPAPTPDFDRALTQHAGEHADRLPLYTTFDVVTLAFCSALEADQVEATVARQRYRLHLLSSQLARSDELEWGRKTATGVSSWSGERNYKEWSHLERKTHRPSYQGLWTDPVTGIAYARHRWYDMRSASWLSEDPMGAVDSQNLYAFVGWGPHEYTDPLGLQETPPWFIWSEDPTITHRELQRLGLVARSEKYYGLFQNRVTGRGWNGVVTIQNPIIFYQSSTMKSNIIGEAGKYPIHENAQGGLAANIEPHALRAWSEINGSAR